MPAHEIDPEDPLELTGAVLPTTEDLDEPMAAAFVEEFFQLGLGPDDILGLFRNPQYLGPHRVWRLKGDERIRELIADTLAPWMNATPVPSP
jgi:hypothetical protein